MAYYHVFIETNNPGERYYELDKTDLSDIKEEVILPYMQGLNFVFDGYFFKSNAGKTYCHKKNQLALRKIMLTENG